MWMHRASLLVVAVLAPSLARADSDAQLWLAAGASHDLTRRVAIELEQELRFDQDMSRVAAVLPELRAGVEVVSWLRLGGGYRFAYERDGSGDLVIRHRLDAEARPRVELGPVRLGYRLRFQEQLRGADGMDGFRHTLRNRVDARWRVARRLAPGASAEAFHSLGDGEAIRLHKLRFTFGTAIDLDTHEVELFYRLELPRDDPDDPTLHIVGLAYAFAL
jgi:hypothetical protein